MLEASSESVFAVSAAAVIGLFVGSFLNVAVYRVPRGLSVVAPRSFCPTCDRQLEWWENVPVVSWVLLGGKCRSCREGISPRYPLVELLTGIAFAFVTWGWHGSAAAIGYCGLAATMITIACVEYGGLRSPLSIAATGVALSEAALLVASGLQRHWRVGLGSVIGLALGVVLYAVLRSRDPECSDHRGHGRSALLVAGSWIGGLGTLSIVVGLATSAVVFLACLVAARRTSTTARVRAGVDRVGSEPPVLAAPLVSAISVGLVVSLVCAR